jgi:hypothetical protein
LDDIANIVTKARRALTYTYAIRFFLEGKNKQIFYDFIQGELEASLEKLNRRNEEDWSKYLEVDEINCNLFYLLNDGIELMIGKRFLDFKSEVISLKNAVENHFSRVISQIEAGLPEVKDEANFCRELVSAD